MPPLRQGLDPLRKEAVISDTDITTQAQAYQDTHPEVDWDANEVTFDFSWPDKEYPPVFTANGWTPKLDQEELRQAHEVALTQQRGKRRGHAGA